MRISGHLKNRFRNFIYRNIAFRGVKLKNNVGSIDRIYRWVQEKRGKTNLVGSSWLRFQKVNSLDYSATFDPDCLPAIELLIVAARKDFHKIKYVVSAALESSLNPIDHIALVVPDNDMSDLITTFDKMPLHASVIPESKYLDKNISESIRQKFGARSGWFIQQFIKVSYAQQSQSQGVLVLDADTLLLARRIWLDRDSSQPLMPTYEFNEPYYFFLQKIFPGESIFLNSFVAHHMLIQPRILIEALDFVCDNNLLKLWHLVVKYADLNSSSPICIDYELYAQWLLRFHPKSVFLVKWGNINFLHARNELDEQTFEKIKVNYRDFGSVSLHTYLN